MNNPNAPFFADLRAATVALETLVGEMRSLRTVIARSLADPSAPPQLFRDLESAIANVRAIRTTVDRIVVDALDQYAGRFGEYRPCYPQLN
jgi:hypothetical protein